MADTIRSRTALLALFADNTAGDISAQDVRDFTVSAYEPQMIIPGGRLTLTTGVPVTTTDVTGATNIYYTPYLHNGIGLYDGTSWTLFTFSEITFALGTLSNNTNYDLFLYDNSGTLTLEATAWTNDTTRATALTLQDGVYVKSGATTRRYLGTFRTTSTTTTEDSRDKRFLWNAYNRVRRSIGTDLGSTLYTYATTAWREMQGVSTYRRQIVQGLAIDPIEFQATVLIGAGNYRVSVGEDSTSPTDAVDFEGGGANPSTLYLECTLGVVKTPSVGYHYYALLEYRGSGTVSIYTGLTEGPSSLGLLGTFAC